MAQTEVSVEMEGLVAMVPWLAPEATVARVVAEVMAAMVAMAEEEVQP